MNDSAAATASRPRRAIWAGRILSALPIPMLVYGAGAKLGHERDAVVGLRHLGLPDGVIVPIAVLELVCVVLYVSPRTAVLGAILVTGFMGGAVLAHLRVGEPFITPIVVGTLVWVGLFLRDPRIRALLPLRS
jgi:hypothetical protein